MLRFILFMLLSLGHGSLLIRKFELYTRFNPNGVITGDELPLDFDKSKETFVLVNGMVATSGTKCIQNLKNALLENGDYNILVPDYSSVSISYMFIYQQVAYALGNFLTRNNLVPSRTTIVGGSLGAHVAGMIRKLSTFPVETIIENQISGKLMLETGLDPAGPGFDTLSGLNRLSTNSANYVMAVHSNMGRLGTSKIVGHDDIIINGGNNFPCCSNDLCHHIGSCDFFIDTIKKGPVAGKLCSNILTAQTNSCKGSNTSVGFRSPKPNRHRIIQVLVTKCS